MSTSVSEQEMVHRYVRNELQGDDLALFETWLLDHPEYLEDIDTLMNLREGIRHGAAFDLSDADLRKPRTETPLHKRGTFAAMTALLSIAILAPVFLIMQQQQASENLFDQVQTLQAPYGAEYTLTIGGKTRSLSRNQADGQILLDGTSTKIILDIELPDPIQSYTDFELLLAMGDKKNTIRPSQHDNSLRMFLHSDFLDASDDIHLRLRGKNQAGLIKDLREYTITIETD